MCSLRKVLAPPLLHNEEEKLEDASRRVLFGVTKDINDERREIFLDRQEYDPDDDPELLDISEDQLAALSQRFTQEEYEDSDDDESEGGEDGDGVDTCSESRLDMSQLSQSQSNNSVFSSCSSRDEIQAGETIDKPPALKKPRFHEDSDEIHTISVNGVARVFYRGEAFTSNANHLRGKVFVIEKFIRTRGELSKKAHCRVYRKVSDTYIESYGADEHAYTVDFLLEKLPLSKLHVRVKSFLPGEGVGSDTLIWHPSPTETKGMGFDVAYSFPGVYSFDMNGYDSRPKVLELFSGAGGMTVGLERAGLDVCWAVEKEPAAASTWGLNHRNGIMFEEDVNVFFKKVKEGIRPYCDVKPNHIHGSPPCQGFSGANRTGGKNDEMNKSMTDRFIDIVKHFEPLTVSMENVPGLLTMSKNQHYIQRAVASLLEAGYQVRLQLANASSLGDPQERKRVILLAAKNRRPLPSTIKGTHGNGPELQRIVTPEDVMRDLEVFEPSEGAGIISLPNGITYGHRKEGTTLRSEREKLDPVTPAKTVRKSNGYEHYSKKRGLTVRELARLQSFPDSHRFFGSETAQRSQIGNAVPCNLAEAVGRAIMESYP